MNLHEAIVKFFFKKKEEEKKIQTFEKLDYCLWKAEVNLVSLLQL